MEDQVLQTYLLHDPGRIDHDIYGTQVRGDLAHGVRNRLLVPDVDVVELHRYARRRVQFGRGQIPQLLPPVQQGDGFGARFGERLGHVPA